MANNEKKTTGVQALADNGNGQGNGNDRRRWEGVYIKIIAGMGALIFALLGYLLNDANDKIKENKSEIKVLKAEVAQLKEGLQKQLTEMNAGVKYIEGKVDQFTGAETKARK